jgi:lipopolysaccharide transport system ATP-binding protein
MSEVAISVRDLSKRFKLYRTPWHRVLEWITLARVVRHETFWALQGVSFDVRAGECLGIIGVNGAGKTTLLKILSRALYPTAGEFTVKGRLVSLLELGTGFHPELTGRQNILQSARLLGFPEEDVWRRLPAILDFAEIGEFIDQPVKQYSSGMFVRLAFSLFAHLEPDVYIVDEALSVGDIFFQQKCFNKFRELRRRGCTVVFVSHDMDAITYLCDRAVLLSNGKVASEGDPRSVVHDYFALMGESSDAAQGEWLRGNAQAAEDSLEVPEQVQRQLEGGAPGSHALAGTGGVEIIGFAVAGVDGGLTSSATSGGTLRFWYLVEARAPCDDLNVGIHLYDRRGILVFAVSTASRDFVLPRLAAGERMLCLIAVTLSVQPGEYTVVPQLAGLKGGALGVVYDRLESVPPILVTRRLSGPFEPFYGLVELKTEIAWTRRRAET